MADDNPKIATQGQWEDLVDKIQSKATITMTTTDPGEDSPLAANNYIGVYGGDPIIMDYSTSEINTGTKWIDGSTIYKKTINFGALPNSTEKNMAHGISSLQMIIKIEAFAATSDDTVMPLPFTGSTSTFDVSILANDTNVRITTYSDRSAYSAYVTLYYIKSS